MKKLTRNQIVSMVEESLRSGGASENITKKEWDDLLRYWKTAPIAEVRGEAETCFGWTAE